MHARDWLLVLIGFFIPPIPVLVKRGIASPDFWINILLCLLGFIPGLLHCYYIILCYPYSESYVSLGGDNGATYGSTG